MVQNNKVLTVSYGTFSCTLEGFDDSFGTMKAIAEYFRDLAADDRYFGAEPPQPDTEMLARIAQREISRQVEARRESTGIVLRAAEPASVAAAGIAVTTAQSLDTEDRIADAVQPDEAEADAHDEQLAGEDQEPVTEALSEDTDATESDEEQTDVAADEVEQAAPEAEAEPAEELVAETDEGDEDAVSEDEPVEVEADEAELDEAELTEEIEDELDAEEDLAAFEADTDEADSGVLMEEPAEVADFEDMADESGTAEFVEPDAAASNSIAAKLERIRAVVSRNEDETQAEYYEEDDYSEDEHAADAEPDAVMADAVADISAALDADAERDDWDDFDEDEAIGVDDTLFADLDEEFFGQPDTDDTDDTVENILGSDETPAPVSAPARVLKVKREEFETALDDGMVEAVTDEHMADDTLSPDEEADLMAELAEVEASLTAGDDATDEDEAWYEEDFDDEQEVAETRPPAERDEGDLSRLMAEADEMLDDPKLSTNRETYSHLRAAVAAAEAERSIGGTVGTRITEDDDPYREDLASVVRRNKAASSGKSERPHHPEHGRPAPLKLVAEQRVDLHEDGARRGPVRPRRISDVKPEDTEADGGFAEFAAKHGAVSLPDLLEAAASYLSFVEGHEQFSRPQLMNKVRQLDNRDFNREDGLRSFGQLLRDGKIEKTSGGRFTASGEIGFRPGERAAG